MPCSPTGVSGPSGSDHRKSLSPGIRNTLSRRAGSGSGDIVMFSSSEPENRSGRWGIRAICSRRSKALMSWMSCVPRRIFPAFSG